MKRNVFVLAWLGGLLFFAGSGAPPPLAQSGSHPFSDQAVVLAPPRLPDGLNVGNLFAEWGITFTNEFGSPPVSFFAFVFPLNAGFFHTPAIVNPDSGEAGVGDLTMHFAFPLRRASITLGAVTSTISTATAFDADGEPVDQSSQQLVGAAQQVQLMGFHVLESHGESGIHRIDIAYEDPTVPQILFVIAADFVDPPVFRRCAAQVAHGALPDGRMLETQLSLTSPAPLNLIRPWIGAISVAALSLDFFDSSGAPLPVALNGEISSQVTGTLAPRESKVFATTEAVSASGLDAGYACLTSNYPLEMAAVFRVLDETGGVVAEAGIDGQRPGHRFVGLLEKDPIEETNTALALANVSESETTAAVSFFLAPNTTFTAEVVLGPGEHGSWFADELSLQLADRDAVGTVEILSDQPIVGTILRTIRGVVSASLPLNRQRAADEE